MTDFDFSNVQITEVIMIPVSYFNLPPFEVIRGTRVIKLFRFDQKTNPESPAPFPLTLFDAIEMDFRKEPHEGSELYVTLSLGDGLAIVGDDNNELLIDISSEKANGFQVKKRPVPIHEVISGNAPDPFYEGTAYFQISFLKGGQVSSTGSGTCKILANVTRLPK